MSLHTNTLLLTSEHLDDLEQAALALIEFGKDETLWLFDGQMGAGKTTFIKKICKSLKINDLVSSPTFSIVNEYRSEDAKTVYHFDCYRLKSEEEAFAIGIEEYLDSGNLCLIEWASRIENLLPAKYLLVQIEVDASQKRTIRAEKVND